MTLLEAFNCMEIPLEILAAFNDGFITIPSFYPTHAPSFKLHFNTSNLQGFGD